MAGYGYAYRGGFTTYSTGAPLPTDNWSKPSYTSDHACQPAIIDAEGRRNPIMISYTPDGNTEYYVTKTEIVEHVPLVTGYKQSSNITPVKYELVRDYGDVQSKWNRPSSSPEKWRRPASPVLHHAEEKWNRPSSSPEKWRRPASPVRYHAEEKWNRAWSPGREHRPQQVEDFITKVQTEASRPNKFGNLSNWRQTPNPHHVDHAGYGDHDLSNRERKKPSNGAAWSTPEGAHLSKPTNDINTAMEFLMEAAKPSSAVVTHPPPSRYSMPSVSSAGPKRGGYSDTIINSREAERRYGNGNLAAAGPKRGGYSDTIIDSREAERRYGNGNLAAAGARPRGNYATTIDSREAARKYGGTTV